MNDKTAVIYITTIIAILSLRFSLEIFNFNNSEHLLIHLAKRIINYLIFISAYLSILIIGGLTGFGFIIVWPVLYFAFYLAIILTLHKKDKFRFKIFRVHLIILFIGVISALYPFFETKNEFYTIENYLDSCWAIFAFTSLSFLYFLAINKGYNYFTNRTNNEKKFA